MMGKPETSPAPKQALLAEHPLAQRLFVSQGISRGFACLGKVSFFNVLLQKHQHQAEPSPRALRVDFQRGKTALSSALCSSSPHQPAPVQPSSLGRATGQGFVPPCLRAIPSFCLPWVPQEGDAHPGKEPGVDGRGVSSQVSRHLPTISVFQLLVLHFSDARVQPSQSAAGRAVLLKANTSIGKSSPCR